MISADALKKLSSSSSEESWNTSPAAKETTALLLRKHAPESPHGLPGESEKRPVFFWAGFKKKSIHFFLGGGGGDK
jgi:hypothetical protein